MRPKIIAGNWKMYKTVSEAETAIASLANHLSHSTTKNKIYLAASFIALDRIIRRFGDTAIQFGAQNLSEHAEGAFTGEISGAMLSDIGCKFVIIGHSERRQYFGESDTMLLGKMRMALANKLEPVFCCGELLEKREAGEHFHIIRTQLENTLYHLTSDELSKVVIAYEPVWAIGTGVTASPEQAQEMHEYIRSVITDRFGVEAGEKIIILYGGSVKANNATLLFSQPDIDGGLVGGASLSPDEFARIIEAV